MAQGNFMLTNKISPNIGVEEDHKKVQRLKGQISIAKSKEWCDIKYQCS
jgi:hypothetical protein